MPARPGGRTHAARRPELGRPPRRPAAIDRARCALAFGSRWARMNEALSQLQPSANSHVDISTSRVGRSPPKQHLPSARHACAGITSSRVHLTSYSSWPSTIREPTTEFTVNSAAVSCSAGASFFRPRTLPVASAPTGSSEEGPALARASQAASGISSVTAAASGANGAKRCQAVEEVLEFIMMLHDQGGPPLAALPHDSTLPPFSMKRSTVVANVPRGDTRGAGAADHAGRRIDVVGINQTAARRRRPQLQPNARCGGRLYAKGDSRCEGSSSRSRSCATSSSGAQCRGSSSASPTLPLHWRDATRHGDADARTAGPRHAAAAVASAARVDRHRHRHRQRRHVAAAAVAARPPSPPVALATLAALAAVAAVAAVAARVATGASAAAACIAARTSTISTAAPARSAAQLPGALATSADARDGAYEFRQLVVEAPHGSYVAQDQEGALEVDVQPRSRRVGHPRRRRACVISTSNIKSVVSTALTSSPSPLPRRSPRRSTRRSS